MNETDEEFEDRKRIEYLENEVKTRLVRAIRWETFVHDEMHAVPITPWYRFESKDALKHFNFRYVYSESCSRLNPNYPELYANATLFLGSDEQ